MRNHEEFAAPAGSRIVLAVNTPWNVVNFRSGLVKGLIDRGCVITVLAPRDAYVPAVEALGCRFAELPMRSHGRSPLQEIVVIARFVRVLRRQRPACILAYTPKPNVYGSIAAALCGVPIINNIPGLGLVFNEAGILAHVLRLLYRLVLRRSKKVFFQNAHDMQLFIAEKLVPRAAADLLPGSGVNLRSFEPADVPDGPFTFLLVARLLWEKGIAEYVEAGRMVRVLHPKVRICILGFIDEESRAGVPRAQIDAWQAQGAIEYLGSAADVRPHLASASCIVLPSYYREGTPRTLIEAAAMGKPIITSDMPGCRDVVDDENGFIVPPRDVGALAARMREMIEMPLAKRSAMGVASRAKAEREYDEQIIVRKYVGVLERIGALPPA